MTNFGDVPSHGEMGEFGRKFIFHLTATELRWLRWNKNWFERLRRITFEECLKLSAHLGSIDIADDEEGQIVRHVTRLIIFHYLLLRELVVDVDQSDHGKPISMLLVGSGEKQLRQHAVGIIRPHGKLATDDFLLLGILGSG